MDDSKPVTRKKAEHSVRYLEDDFVFFPLNLIGLCRNRKWFEFLFFFFFFLFFLWVFLSTRSCFYWAFFSWLPSFFPPVGFYWVSIVLFYKISRLHFKWLLDNQSLQTVFRLSFVQFGCFAARFWFWWSYTRWRRACKVWWTGLNRISWAIQSRNDEKIGATQSLRCGRGRPWNNGDRSGVWLLFSVPLIGVEKKLFIHSFLLLSFFTFIYIALWWRAGFSFRRRRIRRETIGTTKWLIALKYYRVLLVYTGFYCVLLGFTGFYRVLLGLLWSDRV